MRPSSERYGGPDGDPGPGGEGPRPPGPCDGTECDPDLLRAATVITEEVRDLRPHEVPDRLCAVALRLLPVAGASVSLSGEGMPVRLGASGELAAGLAEIQASLGEGPCLDAAREGSPVLAPDLRDGRDAHRWPVFALAATAAGARAVYSIPVGDSEVTVGTLDLHRTLPGPLSARELRRAELVARVMALAVTALPRQENAGAADEDWLSGLAAEHDEVYQAVGMTMAQLGIGADEALARLRGHAFAQGRTALELAREVVARRERLDDG
ncbi:GAF and ANTAR domain-containing protein [Streptomyces sediminimaris]|uniref:GAF and ANTAR domain-containing protein n=1 Tax=Streptomyces sediminimaris TaxID=3383721 RepID=UPI00399BE1CF